MKKQLVLAALLCTAFTATAQEKAYFQQDVAYDIRVTLDDQKHELRAFETLIYKNNSPDQLPFIYMHLWPNAYKDNNTALGKQLKAEGDLFFYYADDVDRGFIDSLDFKVDGQPVKLEYDAENPDIAKIYLSTPLMPGGQITITTPFRVKIPSGKISRLGHIQQQYQITQWYPKPAVYDKNGWNQMPYLNQGEFYSEFGTFDVYITLPRNYVLGATGDLQDNPEEKKWLDAKAEATKEIKSYDKKDLAFPASSAEMKTLHFRQEHVHDFAWFCDKRYHVLKGEVELPHTKRKVTTWVMYTNQYANTWKNAISYVNDALYYYSLWNGDYTYNHCTAVDGALSAGGGMEYPNITVIGAVTSPMMLDLVITHEVGHNWFYGMLGSNERVHGWLDEGINSANEQRYILTKYPNAALVGGANGPSGIAKKFDLEQYKQRAQYYQLYAFCAHTHIDQPIETHSADFISINYAAIMYYKSAVVFNYLRAYLGDSLYDKAFQAYFDRWHWKHPQPEDIRATFEEVTGKNLSWFFDDLIKTRKVMDYKIVSVPKFNDPENKLGGQIVVMVKNAGEINGPVMLNAVKDDKIVQTQWYEGFSGKLGLMFPGGDYDYIRIDQPEWMPEINRKNNIARTHGIFKKTEPLKLQFVGSLDNPERTQLFWTPTIGYNAYDKFMVGAAVYNHVMPSKTFEWLVMPMYSVGDNSVVGHAEAFFNFYPNSVFQDIRIGANANRYNFYTLQENDFPLGTTTFPDRRLGFTKVAPEILFDFKKGYARSPVSQAVKLRMIWLQTDEVRYSFDATGNSTTISPIDRTFYEASYIFRNARKVHPFDFTVELQQGDEMMKAQVTGNYHINISARKTIDIRVFGGAFIDEDETGRYFFRMSGWGPRGFGNQDYLFDHIFLGRSEKDGLLAQQFAIEDGGFKMYTGAGNANKWLAAANLTVPIPVKNKLLGLIKFYGDFGIYRSGWLSGPEFLYNAGAQVTLIPNICEVYFPLVYSSSIKDYYDANGFGYGKMIRFTLNLNTLNPSNLVRNFRI